MNNRLKRNLTTLTLTAVLAVTGILPAHAKTADDIQQCREALSAEGNFAADAHTVKFLGTRGNTQNKAVRLRIKDKSSAEKQIVNCILKKGKVVDILTE